MKRTVDPFQVLGLGKIPWMIKVYLILLIAFTALVLISSLLPDAQWLLISYAFKAILVGLLTALSFAVKRHLGGD